MGDAHLGIGDQHALLGGIKYRSGLAQIADMPAQGLFRRQTAALLAAQGVEQDRGSKQNETQALDDAQVAKVADAGTELAQQLVS